MSALDKKKQSVSLLLSRFRGWIQAAATLLTNIHLPNFFKGGIYQGKGKTVCVPGLNCYSCPAASGACPIGAFQAVVGSSKFRFSYYITGILILLGVAVFLISNTITVGISVRREEIGIMKLIGATDYFVRAPFVVEGIVIGLIGAAIPLGILYVLYEKIILYIGDKFKFISNMIQFLSVDQVFHTLVPVALLLGVGIGFIGSRITIRKHLKV